MGAKAIKQGCFWHDIVKIYTLVSLAEEGRKEKAKLEHVGIGAPFLFLLPCISNLHHTLT